MGLSDPDITLCFVCGGEVTEEQARRCAQCGTVSHQSCLEWSGNARTVRGPGGDDRIELECPNCGHTGRVEPTG